MPEYNNASACSPVKRIIILGHSGFIGTALMNRLPRHFDDVEVVGFSSKSMDLTDPEQTRSLVPLLNRQTIVILCAAIKRHVDDSLTAFKTNIQMMVNTIRFISDCPVKKVVYFSSPAIYGEDRDDLQMTEETPVHPTSYYGSAKYAGESLLYASMTRHDHMQCLILRPSLVYGDGDEKEFYRPGAFCRDILTRHKVTLWGDGNELRDFIFIDDVADLTCRLICNESTGVYNLASGQTHSFRDIIDILDSGSSKFDVYSKARTRKMVNQGFEIARLRTAVPDFEFTTLKQGVMKTYHAILSRNRDGETNE